MLRHLGAAYYESLHGRATRVDVARALDTVEERLNEPAAHPAPSKPAGGTAGQQADRLHHPGGWARRVKDVMTTSVVTVVSGLPVLTMGRHVTGVVTEADLLAAEVATTHRLRSEAHRSLLPHRQQDAARTAAELMTTPAITIGPGATIPAAARLMDAHHVRMLPVVNEDGKLVAIVSRRDLLSVFLRPDDEVASDVRRVLDDFLLADPGDTKVTVRNGIVTLTGTPRLAAGRHGDLIPIAIRLMWDVDGVVDIVDKFGEAQAPAQAPAQAASSGQPQQQFAG